MIAPGTTGARSPDRRPRSPHAGAGAGVGAGDRGTGSIVVVAIVGAMLMVTAAVAPLGAVLSSRQRSAGAADAAALAAADVAIGITAGVPCAAAAESAEANGSRLTGCTVDGLVVTVRVEASAGPFPITSGATAGPAPP